MKVLAIQLNQPGDAILTTPTLRWLMRQGHKVHVLVQPVAAQLLGTMDGLCGLHALKRGSLQFARDLRRWRDLQRVGFDWAIVFSHCSERPALWARLSGARKRTALLGNLPKFWRWVELVNDWHNHAPWVGHVVEQHLGLAGAQPADAESARLEYVPAPEALDWHAQWLHRHHLTRGGYVHFHLTARWPSKCWPVKHARAFLRQATEKISLPLVVTTGPAEFELQYAARSLEGTHGLLTELGTLRPHQLGAIIAGAGAYLGMDSMPMHLAAALQIPGVALFGSTNADQWGPWRSRVEVIRTPDAKQRMAAIEPQVVVERLRAVIATTAGKA